jgi:hypothetical protein
VGSGLTFSNPVKTDRPVDRAIFIFDSLIRLSIIERITASVKRKTDLKLFCYNYPVRG